MNHTHAHGCKGCSENDAPLSPSNELQSVFKISGADCSDEVNAIKKALSQIGLSKVSVNLVASTATVEHPASISLDKIRNTIESTGVKVIESDEKSFTQNNKNRIALIAVAGAFLIAGIALEMTKNLSGTLALLLYGISTLTAGVLVFPKAFRAVKSLSLDMNVLMTVAVVGAFAIKEYSEAATVVFLFSLAELLESFSVAKARQAIRAVLKLTPQMANVREDDKLIVKPVLEVKAGDIIFVKPGDSFPLDGEITEGVTFANQASLTGESNPVKKQIGDTVYAGTINENGGVSVKVTKAFQDTKISKIIRLIEDASEQKAPSEQFVNKFARVYTPIVFLIALAVCSVPPLVFGQMFEPWFYKALVLLVIACPCALVLATPISVVSGLASLAKSGVLVKGGKYLEALGRLEAVALDKTGTITEGKFKVQNYKSFSETSKREVIRIAVGLESLSTHPLAKAIIEYGREHQIDAPKTEKFTNVSGRGAEGFIGECNYYVGNHRWTHDLGLCTPEIESHLKTLEEQSQSVVIVGHKPHANHKGSVLGIFGLGDTIKENATQAVAELHKVGIKKVIVLSGDNQKTVDAICVATGIDSGVGELLPENKVDEVKKLLKQYQNVAMVGDGVNDAPALATATVGISMGAAGTDTAIETSDISLMQDDLRQLPKAILQGRKVLNVIRFNIAFAIVIKAIFLSLTIFGYSNLWLAVAADMGASIFVTINALRLLKSRVAL